MAASMRIKYLSKNQINSLTAFKQHSLTSGQVSCRQHSASDDLAACRRYSLAARPFICHSGHTAMYRSFPKQCFSFSRQCFTSARQRSTSTNELTASDMFTNSNAISQDVQQEEVVEYPPVKPRYPPGRWTGFSRVTAWFLHSRRDFLRSIPSAKLRLEAMAGDDEKILWIVDPFDKRPNNLDFKKFLTRTHLAEGLPSAYNSLDVDKLYNDVKPMLTDVCTQELKFIHKSLLEPNYDGAVFLDGRYATHRSLGLLLCTLRAFLAKSTPHVLSAQLDENVRLETFWHVSGFSGEGKPSKGKRAWLQNSEGKDVGMLTFQLRHKTAWQLRTEQPLPQMVAFDDSLCSGQLIPKIDFTPGAALLAYNKGRPISVSGHWIGSPCEWTALSLHTMPTQHYAALRQLGEKVDNEAQLTYGISAAFGSCVAQAHNQGFCHLLDVTYPITTQCIVSDGNWVRFFVYQLNTLEMWKDYSEIGNPKCNLAWATPAMPLYQTEDKTEGVKTERTKEGTQTFNPEVVKLFLKCLTLKPGRELDLNLRPYLDATAEKAVSVPLNVEKYINHKGEEVLPVEKIGRFEYPKKAVYF